MMTTIRIISLMVIVFSVNVVIGEANQHSANQYQEQAELYGVVGADYLAQPNNPIIINTQKGTDEQEEDKVDDRVWTFSFHLWTDPPYEYIDDEGNLAGIYVDMINEVCKQAGKHCELMYDDVVNCNKHQDNQRLQAGPGLMGQWYDACVGYYKVPERIPVFDFSDPFIKYGSSIARMYVLEGNPLNFDPENPFGRKIGFLSGFAADEECIVKHMPGKESILPGHKVYASSSFELAELLRKKEIDVAYHFVNNEEFPGIEPIGQNFVCSDPDTYLIMRKGSPLRQWWNEAFARFVEHGKYYGICFKAERKYGINIDCL